MTSNRSILLCVLLFTAACDPGPIEEAELEDEPALEEDDPLATDIEKPALTMITAPPIASPEELADRPGYDEDGEFELAPPTEGEDGAFEGEDFGELDEGFQDYLASEDDPAIATSISGLYRALGRPHWGSRRHGDHQCSSSPHVYASNRYNNWSVYRWGGCHATVYYRIGSSIRSRGTAWINAVDRAFKAWDIGTRCSPHFVNVSRGPAGAHAKVEVEFRGRNGHCSSSSTWYACVTRDRAVSSTDQHWWLNLNTQQAYGVSVRGRLDVQSLVAVELAHILYFAHNPNYNDSISTANVGRWGNTFASMGQADSCGFRSYTAHCTNCGNRRSLLGGDHSLVNHLYRAHPNGCDVAGQRVCGCNGSSHYSKVCRSNHTWSGCAVNTGTVHCDRTESMN